MLWNWNVMDACFIAESWHIRSKGMFAGSCIGVVLLVIALEALKWSGRRYDAYLIRLAQKAAQGKSTSLSATPTLEHDKAGSGEVAVPRKPIRPRLKVLQQVIRSFIHMLQFGVAYFVMLLAMYYNG
jgi:copper transporter 1